MSTLHHPASEWARHPLHSVEDEARHLHELEVAGENAATPLLSIATVATLLLPILILVMGASFAGYYLA